MRIDGAGFRPDRRHHSILHVFYVLKERRNKNRLIQVCKLKERERGRIMSHHQTGQEMDMLHGSIWKKLPVFALPVAATGILEQLFNASDLAVVGNFTGSGSTAAVAAVGANTSLIGLILNLFIGVSLGTNVVIALGIGQKNKSVVTKAVHSSILFAVLGGLAVGLGMQFFASPLLALLQVPADVFDLALVYLRIYLIGLPVILLYNFEAAIFRSVGETRMPLIALAVSGVLNVLLNLFFVIVLHMSVEGVAIATVISNAVSSILLYIRLRRTDQVIHVDPRKLKMDWYCLGRILKIGVPAGVQTAVFSLANIVIQSAINSLGTIVMAASSAAFNIEIFCSYVFSAFTQACTTFTGQNFGAGQIKRCGKILRLSLLESFVCLAVSVVIVLLFGKNLLVIFNNNPEVIETGYIRLVLITLSFFFSMFYDIISGYLRGFGISLVPALLTMIGVCGTRLLWIQTVFPQQRTFASIMMVYPVSLAVTALLMVGALLYYNPQKRFRNETAAEEAE